ncbi:MAG: hemerythrin domain-containing protein [Sporichthyaceae bacterium]
METDPDIDITRLILDDHDRFRRAFAALDDLQVGGAAEELRRAWAPLASLLDVHAAAEEEVFYPHLLRRGGDEAPEETLDAVGDHNEIRDAVEDASRHEVGSAAWWASVGRARAANTEHMGEEEDEALADFRRHADLPLRTELGQRFLAFKRRHAGGADLDVSNTDPQDYVEAHTPAPRDGSLGIGSLHS